MSKEMAMCQTDPNAPEAWLELTGDVEPQMIGLFHNSEDMDSDPQVWVIVVERKLFHPDMLGLIPSFFDEEDERSVIEQIDANYQHGGGWLPLEGMTLEPNLILRGRDPRPYQAIATHQVKDCFVIVFEAGMTAVVERDGSYQVARLD